MKTLLLILTLSSITLTAQNNLTKIELPITISSIDKNCVNNKNVYDKNNKLKEGMKILSKEEIIKYCDPEYKGNEEDACSKNYIMMGFSKISVDISIYIYYYDGFKLSVFQNEQMIVNDFLLARGVYDGKEGIGSYILSELKTENNQLIITKSKAYIDQDIDHQYFSKPVLVYNSDLKRMQRAIKTVQLPYTQNDDWSDLFSDYGDPKELVIPLSEETILKYCDNEYDAEFSSSDKYYLLSKGVINDKESFYIHFYNSYGSMGESGGFVLVMLEEGKITNSIYLSIGFYGSTEQAQEISYHSEIKLVNNVLTVVRKDWDSEGEIVIGTYIYKDKNFIEQ